MIPGAKVETVPNSYNYILLEEYKIKIRGVDISVPAGFKTDFATVPRWLQSIYPAAGVYKECALVHDYLLKNGFLREYCDKMFYYMMRDNGISRRYYIPLYLAVRARTSGLV